LWRGANFDIIPLTFSSLRVSQIALVVERCDFDVVRANSLGTLGVSVRSFCGTVLILFDTRQSRQTNIKNLFRKSFCDSPAEVSWRSLRGPYFGYK